MDIDIYVLENAKPIKFHPYSSVVTKRLLEIQQCELEEYNAIQIIHQELLDLFLGNGVHAYSDDKTVFEVEIHGVNIFYGFFDWTFSIGLGCRSY